MAKIRKDNKGRNLHVRESQRADGRYLYTYMLNGKRRYVYDTDLHRLREKERQIEQDLCDGIRTYEALKLTLNDLFKTYMATKDTLKKSTIGASLSLMTAAAGVSIMTPISMLSL